MRHRPHAAVGEGEHRRGRVRRTEAPAGVETWGTLEVLLGNQKWRWRRSAAPTNSAGCVARCPSVDVVGLGALHLSTVDELFTNHDGLRQAIENIRESPSPGTLDTMF